MTHHSSTPPSPVQTEPAAVAEAVRVLLVALVGLGWITLPGPAIAAVVSAVGVLASVALTFWTRRKVTSVAAPRDADKTPLVRAAPGKRLVEE